MHTTRIKRCVHTKERSVTRWFLPAHMHRAMKSPTYRSYPPVSNTRESYSRPFARLQMQINPAGIVLRTNTKLRTLRAPRALHQVLAQREYEITTLEITHDSRDKKSQYCIWNLNATYENLAYRPAFYCLLSFPHTYRVPKAELLDTKKVPRLL